jgi:hypothetical protein
MEPAYFQSLETISQGVTHPSIANPGFDDIINGAVRKRSL